MTAWLEAMRRRQAAFTEGGALVAEATPAGTGVPGFMKVARQAGYRFVRRGVSVHSADQALLRTRNRGAPGPHGVLETDVRRR